MSEGPLLVSHARGAIVGDTLGRVLEAAGHVVVREYYVNDFGNQVRLFADSVVAVAEGKPVPEGGYQGEYVKDVADAVKAAAIAFPLWSKTPIKERVQVFFRYKYLLEKASKELAELCSEENGKTYGESLAEIEKCGLVRDTTCLLHAVGHDDNGVTLLEGFNQLLDLCRGDRIQRGAWLVHQYDGRLNRQRSGDAETLLLATR